jgi:hypothetical protein
MKNALAMITALALAASAFGAEAAAPCRDAKGKFVKCPPAAVATVAKAGPCRDASGAFAKCGTPGARPAGAAAKATTAKKASKG